jgi:hypothetical protein
MNPKALRNNLVLLLMIATFAYLLMAMMVNRFEEGSVFPPYSSLRSDPIGTRAYLESLQGMPNRQVEQNFLDWERLQEQPPGTLFLFGIDSFHFLLEPQNRPVRNLIRDGWRVVISYTPGTIRRATLPQPSLNSMELFALFGPLQLRRSSPTLDEQGNIQLFIANRTKEFPGLPQQIESQSGLAFTDVNRAWRVLYQIGDQPAVIEASFGQGEIVLLSDSYALSNEALWKQPRPGFLLWLTGNRNQIWFDELVHGSRVDTDIADLVTGMRLQGFFVGLILVAVLILWRWGWPLVPPQTSAAILQQQGRDASSGLVQLLMRAVPVHSLLKTCHREWRQHLPAIDRQDLEAQRDIEEMVEQAKPNQLIATYQLIHKRLYARRKRW